MVSQILITLIFSAWIIFRISGSIDRGTTPTPFQKRRRKNKYNASVFTDYFIEGKTLFFQKFNNLPWILFIASINDKRARELVQDEQYGEIEAIYERAYFCWQQSRKQTGRTIFVLKNHMVIEIGDEYAQIMYEEGSAVDANLLFDAFGQHKAEVKEEDHEINIITMDKSGLDLKTIPVSETDLDIDLYYNDDFKGVHEIILERLSKQQDKGIVLLHGLPGTGKTSYLRHLVGKVSKKVLFVSPSVADDLMNPEFVDLLIDNPNSILVIEDAENIIMDRKFRSNSSVSNLLNLSDGLMSDCLNVQIICTFNSPLTMVDTALLRKGRLIARYEFSKLTVDKAKRLSEKLGIRKTIDQPMTLAEITNPDAVQDISTNQLQVIGFRRRAELVN